MNFQTQITTYQALQQQIKEDFYLKTVQFAKGSGIITIVLNIIYNFCINAIISNAEENADNNIIIDFILKSQQVFYALLLYEGYEDYIKVSRRYSQISDILFLILHKYMSQLFIIFLFSFMAYQFPNFQKDTGGSSDTLTTDMLLIPRILNNNSSKNCIYHHQQTLLISYVILVLVIGVQRQIKKISGINIQEKHMLMIIIIIGLIWELVELIQLTFHGAKFNQMQHYIITQFYNVHIYLFGAYFASKIFKFKYNNQELLQEFEIHPTQTPIGTFIVKMCTSKLLLDIYLWALSQFSMTTLYYKDQIVHDKLNFINRTLIFMFTDIFYSIIVAGMQAVYNIAQVQHVREQFDFYISVRYQWIIGSTIFTVVFNQYIFNGIVFGPYNTIMVLILIIGMAMEVYIFSFIFYHLFSSMYTIFINWIDQCGQNCAIFIIKVITGKMIVQ